MRAYSMDLRVRVLADCEAGLSTSEVAERQRVSESWVRRLKQRRRETGEIAPRPSGQAPPQKLAGQEEQLRAYLQGRPDATLEEVRRDLGLAVGLSTLWRKLRELGLTRKKVLRAAEQARPDMAARRVQWQAEQSALDPARLVFLDETWTHTAFTRLYGWGPKGRRVIGSAPAGHWKTTMFLSAFRQEGFTAPWVIDGAVDGALFRAYVEQPLAPTLQRGDGVILDNLSSHKVAGVQAAIEARGANLVYLPPYSPDFNPIENAFAKLKARLRQAEERTVEGLWSRIGEVLDQFSPAECRNYFRHCGYAATSA